MTRPRIFAVLATAIVAIVFISTTLGRAIYEGQSPGLFSFAAVHFAGYLFFLLMPVEALVPIYEAEGHLGPTLITVAVVTALAAQAIDYGIGRAFSDWVIDNVVGHARYERFRDTIERWGGAAILFFNLLPLSSPNMLLVSGIVRYNPAKAFLFSFVGLLGKYVAIVYLVDLTAWWPAGDRP